MNKENILFGVIGLLLGLIIGFVFTNSLNRNGASVVVSSSPVSSQTNASPNANLPAGHPTIDTQQQTPALPEIQQAIDKAKQNPNDFEAQIKVADLYNQIEKYDESAEYLKIANKLKPDNYETIVNLGNVNFDGGKLAEAEKWYSQALAKKKDDANVRTDLGLTFIFRDTPNYDRAIQEFQTVLSANPNHVQALQNMVVAYTRQGDGAKAQETLTKLQSADPTNLAIPKLRDEIQKLPTQ